MSFHMEFQLVTLSRMCVSSKVQWPCNQISAVSIEHKYSDIHIAAQFPPHCGKKNKKLKWPNGFIYPCLFASKMFSATDLFCGKDNQRKETLRGSFETFGFQRSRFSLLWSHTPPIVHTGIAVINLLLSSLSWEGPEPHMVHHNFFFLKYTSNKSI